MSPLYVLPGVRNEATYTFLTTLLQVLDVDRRRQLLSAE